MEDSRIQEGVSMIESMWYGVGVQIVNMAIHVYNLNDAQAKALREAYLKPNDYSVCLRRE